MSALALLAARRGVTVSGCDTDPAGPPMWRPSERQWSPDTIRRTSRGPAPVVATAAIPADHPELLAARTAGIPVVPRKRALADLVNPHDLIAIAGPTARPPPPSWRPRCWSPPGRIPPGSPGDGWRSGEGMPASAGPALRGRGRRVRPGLPRAPSAGGGGEQRRGRPSRDLRHPERDRRCLRGVRRPGVDRPRRDGRRRSGPGGGTAQDQGLALRTGDADLRIGPVEQGPKGTSASVRLPMDAG